MDARIAIVRMQHPDDHMGKAAKFQHLSNFL